MSVNPQEIIQRGEFGTSSQKLWIPALTAWRRRYGVGLLIAPWLCRFAGPALCPPDRAVDR
jgi:hypothetical protein